MDYQSLYNKIVSHRKSNPNPSQDASEKHHIVPKCMGGDNSPDNLVFLTPREHFVAHRLLAKIHPDIYGISLAYFLMHKRDGVKFTSKSYQKSRKDMLENHKEFWTGERRKEFGLSFIGELNPMFGKFGSDHGAFGHKKSEECKEKMSHTMKSIMGDEKRKEATSSNIKRYFSESKNLQMASECKLGELNPMFGRDITNSLTPESRTKQKENQKLALNRIMPWEKKTWRETNDIYWRKAIEFKNLYVSGVNITDIMMSLWGDKSIKVRNALSTITTRLNSGWDPETCGKWMDRYTKLLTPPSCMVMTNPEIKTKKLW